LPTKFSPRCGINLADMLNGRRVGDEPSDTSPLDESHPSHSSHSALRPSCGSWPNRERSDHSLPFRHQRKRQPRQESAFQPHERETSKGGYFTALTVTNSPVTNGVLYVNGGYEPNGHFVHYLGNSPIPDLRYDSFTVSLISIHYLENEVLIV